MGTKAVVYYSNDCLDCGVLPQDVELCVPSSILASKDCPAAAGEDDFTYHTLTASLVKAEYLGQCASEKFKYTFTYDDTQIADGQVFTAAMITGSFCKGCFTQWVEDQVGSESYIRNNQDGSQDYISPHGCVYRIVTGPGSITVDDTNSIDLALTGGVITADSNLSATSGNQVAVNSDGLFVPKAAGLTVTDTNSVDLTLSSGALSADVKISATVGNEITINSDGIFAPSAAAAFITSILDSTSIDLGVSSGVLTAAAKISADVGNMLSLHSDGLYAAGGGGGSPSALDFNSLFSAYDGLYTGSSVSSNYNPVKFLSAGQLIYWIDCNNPLQFISSAGAGGYLVAGGTGAAPQAVLSNDGSYFLGDHTSSGTGQPTWFAPQPPSTGGTALNQRGYFYYTAGAAIFTSTTVSLAKLKTLLSGTTKLSCFSVTGSTSGSWSREIVQFIGTGGQELILFGMDFASASVLEIRANISGSNPGTATSATGLINNKINAILYEIDLAAATCTITVNGVVTSVNNTPISVPGSFNSTLLDHVDFWVFAGSSVEFYEQSLWKDAFLSGAEKTALFAAAKAHYGAGMAY